MTLSWVLASALLFGLLFNGRGYWAWVASGALGLLGWASSASVASWLAVALPFGALVEWVPSRGLADGAKELLWAIPRTIRR